MLSRGGLIGEDEAHPGSEAECGWAGEGAEEAGARSGDGPAGELRPSRGRGVRVRLEPKFGSRRGPDQRSRPSRDADFGRKEHNGWSRLGRAEAGWTSARETRQLGWERGVRRRR